MKCAVFGSNGYIGKHLSLYLSKSGFDVLNYDIQESSDLENYLKLDVSKKDDFSILDGDISKIYYFSGITGTHDGFLNPELYFLTNELGLVNLLSYCADYIPEVHVIFPSTRLVYKGSDNKLSETAVKEAKTVYAVNKIASEYLLNAYSNYYKLKFTIFRICVPFGNKISDSYSYGTIGGFLNQISKNGSIYLYGDGQNRRTFTHIEDICHQIFTASFNEQSYNETFNIDGEDFSLYEIASKLADNFDAVVLYKEWKREDALIESGSTVFDSRKIRSIVSKTVTNTFDYWLKTLKK